MAKTTKFFIFFCTVILFLHTVNAAEFSSTEQQIKSYLVANQQQQLSLL